MGTVNKEKAIRAIVSSFVEAYAAAFSDRHLSEVDDEDGTINTELLEKYKNTKGENHKKPSISDYQNIIKKNKSEKHNKMHICLTKNERPRLEEVYSKS